MSRVGLFVLFTTLLVMSGGLVGQEPKKEPPKGNQNNPPVRVKGMLPMYWGKLGLSDEQKQNIYKIQNKYDAEIDKLEAKIKELKETRLKETRAVLTTDQKKKLEEILLGKQ